MTIHIPLPQAPSRMVREEISKQIRALSSTPIHVAFAADGKGIVCDLPQEPSAELANAIAATARGLERTFRNVECKIVASRHSDFSDWHALEPADGVCAVGRGHVLLHGAIEAIVGRIEGYLAGVCGEWDAAILRPPTLVDAAILRKCDYFRSFPQMVTFAAHLADDRRKVDSFRQREIQQESGSTEATTQTDELAEITTCLSPAMCYHVYNFLQSQVVPAPGRAFTLQGRCFRNEGGGLTTTLARLWEFTMREVVFVGTRDYVLAQRQRALSRAERLLEELDLSAEIRTATDPFFVSADSVAKQYFQLLLDGKLELAAAMPGDSWLAIGSVNYHGDFFGRAFQITCPAGPVHTACFAFGVERLVAALVARHGTATDGWPPSVLAVLREAALS